MKNENEKTNKYKENEKEPTKVIPTLKTITKENNPETNTNTNKSDDLFYK